MNSTPTTQLLTAQGASDTLDFMNQYWVDINGQNEQFWEHEWSKHGTCYSTLETSCLPSGSPKGAEAVAFFQQVVTLFKTLPTYQWLAKAGITPDSSKTFTLSEITSALKSAGGVTPALDCDGKNLNQISWYFHLKGSLLDGKFVPIGTSYTPALAREPQLTMHSVRRAEGRQLRELRTEVPTQVWFFLRRRLLGRLHHHHKQRLLLHRKHLSLPHLPRDITITHDW